MRKFTCFLYVFISLIVMLFTASCKDSSSTTGPSDNKVAVPVFSVAGGTYNSAISVTIECDTYGAEIYYTLDNSVPTENSNHYSEPVHISNSVTLKARAFKASYLNSEVASAQYVINIQVPDNNFEWCEVPAGTFTWGEPSGEETYTSIENISYNYSIMKYDVTNAQYLEYLNNALVNGTINIQGSFVRGFYPGNAEWTSGQYDFYSLGEPMYNVGRINIQNGVFVLVPPTGFTVEDYLTHPVVYVTWFGAWHFAQYYGLRLPTEQEWEKAARGMTGFEYAFGNTMSSDRANYLGSNDPWDQGTSPVGYYNGINPNTIDSPSPYGLYDMTGNTFNWTASFFGDPFGNRMVVKGGGWMNNHNHDFLKTWNRTNAIPIYQDFSRGFRCVK